MKEENFYAVKIPDCIKNYKGNYSFQIDVWYDVKLKRKSLYIWVYTELGTWQENRGFDLSDEYYEKEVEEFIKKYE